MYIPFLEYNTVQPKTPLECEKCDAKETDGNIERRYRYYSIQGGNNPEEHVEYDGYYCLECETRWEVL